jgi:hypothetical protein
VGRLEVQREVEKLEAQKCDMMDRVGRGENGENGMEKDGVEGEWESRTGI